MTNCNCKPYPNAGSGPLLQRTIVNRSHYSSPFVHKQLCSLQSIGQLINHKQNVCVETVQGKMRELVRGSLDHEAAWNKR